MPTAPFTDSNGFEHRHGTVQIITPERGIWIGLELFDAPLSSWTGAALALTSHDLDCAEEMSGECDCDFMHYVATVALSHAIHIFGVTAASCNRDGRAYLVTGIVGADGEGFTERELCISWARVIAQVTDTLALGDGSLSEAIWAARQTS